MRIQMNETKQSIIESAKSKVGRIFLVGLIARRLTLTFVPCISEYGRGHPTSVFGKFLLRTQVAQAHYESPGQHYPT